MFLGSVKHVQRCLDGNVFVEIYHLLIDVSVTADIRTEAIWVIYNATMHGSFDQSERLVEFVFVLCEIEQELVLHADCDINSAQTVVAHTLHNLKNLLEAFEKT